MESSRWVLPTWRRRWVWRMLWWCCRRVVTGTARVVLLLLRARWLLLPERRVAAWVPSLAARRWAAVELMCVVRGLHTIR